MVPKRLELKNFMCYGESTTPVEFDGMHVACLSGDNGHGKTALLDAVTWALWGQARASTDELIRIGSSHMSVTFDFELGGSLYRVIKTAGTRRGSGTWELLTSDGSGGFRPITNQGIRDTGRQIEHLLQMDYRTFINSAYIQQGKADEFTRQTVGDRKKVLADILDLSKYDSLAGKAKEHRDKAQDRVDSLRREISLIDDQLTQEPQMQKRLGEVEQELADKRKRLKVQESVIKVLEKRKSELEANRLHITELETEARSVQSEIEALQERLDAAVERLKADESILEGKDQILDGYNRFQDTMHQDLELEKNRRRLEMLETERLGLERIVQAQKHQTELRLKLAENELREALGRISEKEYLEREAADLRSAIGSAGSGRTNTISREVCAVECRLAQVEQLLLLIREMEKTLPAIRDRVTRLRRDIDSQAFSPDSLRLSTLEMQISQLDYSPEKHAHIREELSGLRFWERRKMELDQAESRLPEDREDVETLQELVSAKQRLVEKAYSERCRALTELEETPELERDLSAAVTEMEDLRAQEALLLSEKAVIDHRLSEYQRLRNVRGEMSFALAAAEEDVSAYTELVKAFGRSGVQSLIIENAVPEIQEEANEVLSRMTDGTMRISLETMRETKTAGAVETLDIRVQDEAGNRTYDLLSGGEAFRVNFALRIALSKLLARRAGAKLETLVIDEGFGTQDGKGREKLIEAIDAVKDDFRMILVITHIEELKDAFPTRIEVVKDRDGSRITEA